MKRGEGEFNWVQKEMKMIASQGSKIAIQSIGSITGHLSDGKHASSSFKVKPIEARRFTDQLYFLCFDKTSTSGESRPLRRS